MESVAKKLQKIGLTEYEAKVYLSLLRDHLNSATKLSEKSGVPRTKIYQVLESLEHKGWIRIYSGIPLLFKAVDPRDIFEKFKKDYSEFLKSIQATLDREVMEMKEKFVILKFDVGLRSLKEEMRKAKTIWINNATTDFLKKVNDTFSKDAEVRVLLFPGEKKIDDKKVKFREAGVKIVCMVHNKEVPSMSITLDESRTFTVFEDPMNHQYVVDEMLYDECAKCFLEWNSLGWNVAKEV
ncbi:MAG: TrmB family transcriptional regulator [archaeon]|nr:TrmB family transcriptional regulator [archaeon]